MLFCLQCHSDLFPLHNTALPLDDNRNFLVAERRQCHARIMYRGSSSQSAVLQLSRKVDLRERHTAQVQAHRDSTIQQAQRRGLRAFMHCPRLCATQWRRRAPATFANGGNGGLHGVVGGLDTRSATGDMHGARASPHSAKQRLCTSSAHATRARRGVRHPPLTPMLRSMAQSLRQYARKRARRGVNGGGSDDDGGGGGSESERVRACAPIDMQRCSSARSHVLPRSASAPSERDAA